MNEIEIKKIQVSIRTLQILSSFRSDIDIDQLQISQQDLRILEILTIRYKEEIVMWHVMNPSIAICQEQCWAREEAEPTQAENSVGRGEM